MKPQVIYSRYEFPCRKESNTETFEEYREMFDNEYNEEGVTVGGITVAINENRRTVILLSFSKEADTFLRLKFYGRKDVRVDQYIKAENE